MSFKERIKFTFTFPAALSPDCKSVILSACRTVSSPYSFGALWKPRAILKVKSMGDLRPAPTIRLTPFPAPNAASTDCCPRTASEAWALEGEPERLADSCRTRSSLKGRLVECCEFEVVILRVEACSSDELRSFIASVDEVFGDMGPPNQIITRLKSGLLH